MIRAVLIFGALLGVSYGEECTDTGNKDSVMLFGGHFNGSHGSKNVMVAGDCDASSADMTVATHDLAVAVLGQQIYICGGWARPNKCFIRERNGKETPGPNLNQGRARFTINNVGSKLVAVGGYYRASVEIMEPGRSWKLQSYKIKPARHLHCAVTISSNSVMLVGGDGGRGIGPLKLTEELNIETGEVTRHPELPEPQAWHACSLYNNQIITTGGNIGKSRSNRVFVLDLSVNKGWTEGPSMLRVRAWHSMEVVNGVPTVYSGVDDGSTFLEVLVNGQWHERPIASRSGSASVVITC